MARTVLSRLSVLSGVGLASYLAGAYIERRSILDKLDNHFKNDPYFVQSSSPAFLEKLAAKPVIPIFGIILAATPTTYGDVPLNKAGRVSQIMKYGFPGLDNVRSFDDYVLSYDRRNKVAHWVFEHLTKESVKHNDAVDRSKCEFFPDESVHPYFRAQNSDYKGSGYDRGHLAAAGNHKMHQKYVDETFVLSNMAPQVGNGFNRHSWNRLERHVRKLTSVYPSVYCCTGPLYLPRKESDGKTYVKYEVIGSNSVAVPTHFYKVVVGELANGHLEMEAYVMPNKSIDDNTPLNVFQVPPDSIERAAGLLFYDKIPKNKFVKINGKKV